MYERVQLLLKTLHDSPSVNTKEHIYLFREVPVSSEPDGALFLLLLFRGTTVTWINWESFLLRSFWGRQREKLNLHGTYNLVYIQVLVRYPDS